MVCVRRFLVLFWLAVLVAGAARAEVFSLAGGQTITGELVSPDEKGAMIRLPDDKYAEVTLPDGKAVQRIPWASFSQDSLKKIMANDKRAATFAEPWIETVPTNKTREKEFTVKTVTRLDRPPAGSFVGGFASSSVGLFILFILYLANLYAAYEVSVVRAYPWTLVCGLAAIPGLGVASPIAFLCLPTRMQTREEVNAEELAAAADMEQQAAAIQQATVEAAAKEKGGLSLAGSEGGQRELPPTQKFSRGQFTFNRRFIETKFANFFGVVRREAEKDMELVFKTARGQFHAERITRIAANEMHLQVRRGPATEEVSVPFVEIQEVILKHKDAPD